MTNVRYRHAKETDIPGMATLSAAKHTDEGYWKERISSYVNRSLHLEKGLEPRVLHVATDGRNLVGFAAGHLSRRQQCDGEVQWLNILPSHRRQGVASDLLRLLAMWFVAQNAERVCVEIDPANVAGREFCKQSGALILSERLWVWNDIKVVSGR
jgi:ribosomal protein S18 acetylase RimI-like enzyme